MLDLSITMVGGKVVLEGLQTFTDEFPLAVRQGLTRAAKEIHRTSFMWLSGAGGAGKKARRDYDGFKRANWGENKKSHYETFRSYHTAGNYPVPVRTGNLRRLLDWLKPGASKFGPAGTFTAGPDEVVIFDSAVYANAIHEGTNSSRQYGPRRFIIDAWELFNHGAGLQHAISQEIQKAQNKAGLT